jgi:hypothetical protein
MKNHTLFFNVLKILDGRSIGARRVFMIKGKCDSINKSCLLCENTIHHEGHEELEENTL